MKRLSIGLLLLLTGILFFIPAWADAQVLTLDDCIGLALRNHQDVIRARGNLSTANGTLWQTAGSFLPTLSFGASASQSDRAEDTLIGLVYNPITEEFFTDTTIDDGFSKSYSMGFSANWTVFNGFRNIHNYMGAKADKKISEYSLEETEQRMILKVKTTYFAYLRAIELKKIREEAVKRGEQQHRLASSKYEVGSASKSDVLKAQVQYGNDKLDLIDAENQLKVAQATLSQLIGLDPKSNVEFSPTYTPREYEGDEMEAVKFGMANHPGLLAYEQNVRAAKYDVRSTYGRFLPSINVSGSRNWSGNRWDDVSGFDGKNGVWSLTTSLSLPIFEGFSRKSDIARSKATLNNARADYYYVRTGVELEIKTAYLDIQRSIEALKVAQEVVASAEEDMAITQEKYNLGAASILDVLDAQVSLVNAQNSHINAIFDHNLAIATLENAMGIR
jgi:TolC family type I secretion outer membrane protein